MEIIGILYEANFQEIIGHVFQKCISLPDTLLNMQNPSKLLTMIRAIPHKTKRGIYYRLGNSISPGRNFHGAFFVGFWARKGLSADATDIRQETGGNDQTMTR